MGSSPLFYKIKVVEMELLGFALGLIKETGHKPVVTYKTFSKAGQGSSSRVCGRTT